MITLHLMRELKGTPLSDSSPDLTDVLDSDTSTHQQYWKQFTQLKEHCIYLHEYIESDDNVEFWKNIILAFGSSAAITTWAVWREYPIVWAIIIGLTQVIQAVSPFLPFKHRAKALMKMSSEMDILCISVEEDWYKVWCRKISNDEVHALYIKYKKSIQKIIDSNLKDISLKCKDKLVQKSKASSEIYFRNLFIQGA